MKYVLHSAESRGHANHGWLDTYHTFSFANYSNPERMHFGKLRVLNDDTVHAGMGFGKHGHHDMEIVSIVLDGELEHQDSMGNTHIIRKNDVQVMSAGTGIEHSEKNRSHTNLTNFLQIWVFPREKNIEPSYDQKQFPIEAKKNKLLEIISPNKTDQTVSIHQDAWFNLGNLENGFHSNYQLNQSKNGLYAFLIKGELIIGEHRLKTRDGIGLWDFESVQIEAIENSELLLIEVPMH